MKYLLFLVEAFLHMLPRILDISLLFVACGLSWITFVRNVLEKSRKADIGHFGAILSFFDCLPAYGTVHFPEYITFSTSYLSLSLSLFSSHFFALLRRHSLPYRLNVLGCLSNLYVFQDDVQRGKEYHEGCYQKDTLLRKSCPLFLPYCPFQLFLRQYALQVPTIHYACTGRIK